jgi:hypothetical protein
LFGAHEQADARLSKCALHPHCSTVEAEILGANTPEVITNRE